MSSSSSVKFDAKIFHRRAAALLAHWQAARDAGDPQNLYRGADAILIPVGQAGEDGNPYQKSTALHNWLLSYELPNTLLVITPTAYHFVASSNKATLLEALEKASDVRDKVALHVYRRTKDDAENSRTFQTILDIVASTGEGKRVGHFPKDESGGKFMDEWQAAYKPYEAKFEKVDVSVAVAEVLAVKDADELKNIRTACKITSLMMSNYFSNKMAAILDADKKVTHEKLSDATESGLWDPKVIKTAKIPADINMEVADWCYAPIIQSGGKYDLKTSAMSNGENLHAGAVVCSFGVRYKSYCSNVGRTFLIDPTPEQEANYKFLLELQARILEVLLDGTAAKDVYVRAVEHIRSRRPELEKHFLKNCGFAIGIEFRESAYLLNAKNTRPLRAGMTVNLALGFQDLENPKAASSKGQTYALSLIDTVVVGAAGSPATALTTCPKQLNDAVFFFNDDDDDEEDKLVISNDDDAGRGRGTRTRSGAGAGRPASGKQSAVLSSKFRSEEREEESAEQKRREHQGELAARKQEAGLARFSGRDSDAPGKDEVEQRRFESYKREAQLPREVQRLQIVVDHKHDTVVLPIYGMAVPFHISTIKNASKSEEGDFVLLRVNLVTPGQIVGKKENLPFDDVSANFLRSISFRSTDVLHMSNVCQQITDMKKNQAKKEAERKEMADIVEQGKLVEMRGHRPFRLPDVFTRPDLGGRRAPGELEIHSNGLRFQHPLKSDQRIDVLFSNVQHLFFQPCDNELIVLLHIHLKNPMLIGKKKTKDVQFYREASDAQFDETGNRRRRQYHYGDEDELEAEQEERRRRAQLNSEFRKFAEKIVEQSGGNLEVDIPFRELGFHGVPFRSNVLLQPTTECLVQLTDMPFTVIPMNDVEIAHLERVQFGLKNFDLVFVYKDFSKPPVHINTIPMAQLDHVKEWLDSMDVVFSEGPVNLNWSAIMKTVNQDPAAFFEEGGWGFLLNEEGSDGDSEEEEPESEFEISDAELDDEESESDDSDEFSSVATESDESPSEGEESGEDWDALEEKARRYDERKRELHGENEEEEEGRGDRQKKRSRR
ncbi:FACT complex subunit spt16 [Tieghemiomyces parasiticus]|uniref:FACT complex subunit n=1 Tax=Tieghemiomyces parasiticus TaxID=78921 RepID=A0A9W8A4U1_9FUNG|nr:FACT complex subunit spt16 [Tieghemiomyces parasiticus]